MAEFRREIKPRVIISLEVLREPFFFDDAFPGCYILRFVLPLGALSLLSVYISKVSIVAVVLKVSFLTQQKISCHRFL